MSATPRKSFLELYFRTVYNKLHSETLHFNRELPHEGLKGSQNEKALATTLRDFLPKKYGVEENVVLIDRAGKTSRECDLVIYDDVQFPRYFKKVYPIEIVHAVVEVKTNLTKQEAEGTIAHEKSLRELSFYPLLAPYWRTRTGKEKITHTPPVHVVFSYQTSTKDFATFANWFSQLPTPTPNFTDLPHHPSANPFLVCALDKGILFGRGDFHISRWLAIAEHGAQQRNINTQAADYAVQVDPAKSLLLFLETLWTMLQQSPRHPGFDIRSYMEQELASFVPFDHEGKIDKRLCDGHRS